jgi:hypothetical protein
MWMDIDGFDNYSVSSKGRVINKITNKILKPLINHHGYNFVNLYNDRKHYNKKIHQLVANAFLFKEDDKSVIDHIDRNKMNNRVSNLRYVSLSDNSKNQTKHADSISKYKGVSFDKSNNKWIAKICIDGKLKHIGCYKTEVEAATAYNELVREISSFYPLNVINPEDLLPVSEPPPEELKYNNYQKITTNLHEEPITFNLNHQNPFHQYNQIIQYLITELHLFQIFHT